MVASGNGGQHNDNCNYDGYANSIYTVTIGEGMSSDSFRAKSVTPFWLEAAWTVGICGKVSVLWERAWQCSPSSLQFPLDLQC